MQTLNAEIFILIGLAVLLVTVLLLQIVLLARGRGQKKDSSHETNEALYNVQRALDFVRNENKSASDELSNRVDRLKDAQTTNIMDLKDAQTKSLTELMGSSHTGMNSVRDKLDERLGKLGEEIRASIKELQASNEKKLEQMQAVVNEKLEATLETRLKKSFETVSTQLESVNKGLGEMRSVAESVGSLNKVLASPKTRGILGELQLGQIIEDMFPPHLYDREAAVTGTGERVEYALKLPGTAEGEHIYLPIDSKFPLEDYYRLMDAYDAGDAVAMEDFRKALMARIRMFAKDVATKYIAPPATTNFAIIFLPTEGLYAEMARDAGFFDSLRKDGVIITGPTTLSALLSSLQIGFNTLQIQKGAAEIEKTLGLVKTEFEKFEGALTKVQQRITQAGTEMENLVGTRTRAINRRLKDVQTYSLEE